MSQSSATPTPQQRNITLALYLPYAWTSSKFAPAGPWGPTSSQAFQIGLDSAAQLAVDEINNSSTGIHVSLIRFNSWDPIRPNPKAKYFSGGYSMLAAQKLVATHPEIAGVIGETFSSTTTYSGEVFSALKIPFCLPSQGSAIFSNKNKYPYVWRMVSGVAIQGSLFLKLLQTWGVTKVALITQDAGSGLSAGLSVISAFENSGIQLSVILRYTLPASTYKNMGFIMSELKRVDARYVIITSQNQDDPAFIYFRAFNQSLAGPGRVWFMNFSPSPTSGKFSDYGGINATQNLEGVVVLQTTPSYSQTAIEFTRRWLQLNQINNNSYPVVNGAPAANTPGSYDCVKTMVAGMMNFVANNASITSLSAPSIRSALIPSVFSNTAQSH
ncbi:periplasmic binding protein-like I [Rhizoclosmatium globosum]|uniref:Periplasmic binding protein-like I n=1 Tax=Rhizoclosmatium globosum TaxID=329046 RepID=A0A1Y2CIN1_9FUNG|nr:periplasmic binding protein-like I [Rhizoclosmatium globosum]|eukprot:ORY46903.1 periplasmic binding protein-like I [Rhizoclosmatium globosum]